MPEKIKDFLPSFLFVVYLGLDWFMNISSLENLQPIVWVFFVASVVQVWILITKLSNVENSRPKIVAYPRTSVFPVIPYDLVTTTATPSSYVRLPTAKSNYDWLAEKSIVGLGADPTTDEVDFEKDNQSWFALVDFYNRPKERGDNSVAKDVSARITYFDEKWKPKVKEGGISGRWWSNDEVVFSDKPRKELERTDIFPGPQGVILALACMGTKDSAIYAYNNDNHAEKDFKKSEFVLGLKSYSIRVVLGGTHLPDKEFWFSVWRDIQTQELKVKQIKRPRQVN